MRAGVGTELEGVLAHDGRAISDAITIAPAPAAGAVVAGHLSDRAALDRALGTAGKSDAEAIAAAYERWGTDGLLRTRGSFAAAIVDLSTRRLVLARDPSGRIPLYVRRDGRSTRFATRLATLGGEADLGRARAWVASGVWPAGEPTLLRGVEIVPAGTALIVEAAGRARQKPFWSFSPFHVPRALSEAQAAGELERAIAAVLDRAELSLEDVRVRATSPAASLIAAHLRAQRYLAPPAARPERDAMLEAARLLEHPVALSRASEVALALAAPGDVAGDWGAREALGGTPGAVRAWLTALAGVFDATPSPRALRLVLQHGRGVDRALARSGAPVLNAALTAAAANVAHRWSRHLPPALAERLVARLPSELPDAPEVERVTGDPFTDRRFADVRSRELEALHAGLARARARAGRRLVAPFLEPEVIESVFSFPPAVFLAEGRTMRIAAGGEPIARSASQLAPAYPGDEAWIAEGARVLGLSRPEDPRALDRLAGFGLFAAALALRP